MVFVILSFAATAVQPAVSVGTTVLVTSSDEFTKFTALIETSKSFPVGSLSSTSVLFASIEPETYSWLETNTSLLVAVSSVIPSSLYKTAFAL